MTEGPQLLAVGAPRIASQAIRRRGRTRRALPRTSALMGGWREREGPRVERAEKQRLLALLMLPPMTSAKSRLSGQRRPMPIQRQRGVEIGIGAQAVAPAGFEIGYLAGVAALL